MHQYGRRILAVGLALLMAGGVAVAGPDRERRRDMNPEKVIRGLKSGIESLRAIGEMEEAAQLERLLKAYVEKVKAEHPKALRRPDGERREAQIVKHRIEVLRIAMHGLLEAEKMDAAERVEHMIHAYELGLAGRRDEEAMEIRKSAPRPPEMAKLLRLAAELWRKFEQPKKAELCLKLAGEFEGAGRPRREKAGGGEREMVKHHVEIMRLALKALLEAEKRDAAHRLEQVIHVYELSLAGKADEARKARERAPDAGQLAELLLYAADFWEKFGNEKNAATVRELGRFYQQRWQAREQRERAGRRGDRPRDVRADRLERMERRMEELQRAMRELAAEIERMRRER